VSLCGDLNGVVKAVLTRLILLVSVPGAVCWVAVPVEPGRVLLPVPLPVLVWLPAPLDGSEEVEELF